MMLTICCTACNKEWEDEQYLHMASFKANVNDQGVTTTYVRFKPGGVVKYDLPVIMSGSTMNNQSHTIHFGLDADTLKRLNNMGIVRNFIFNSCQQSIIICLSLWKCLLVSV